MTMILATLPPDAFWPVTDSGWIALVGLFLSAGATIFAWGKWKQKTDNIKTEIDNDFKNHKDHVKNVLDGFGGRVENMEREHGLMVGRLDEASGHVQRLLGQHDTILSLLGEAKGSSVQCREDTMALGEKLEKRLENMTREMGETRLHLSERLVGVETKMDMLVDKRP